jgi:hypothetical protein
MIDSKALRKIAGQQFFSFTNNREVEGFLSPRIRYIKEKEKKLFFRNEIIFFIRSNYV